MATVCRHSALGAARRSTVGVKPSTSIHPSYRPNIAKSVEMGTRRASLPSDIRPAGHHLWSSARLPWASKPRIPKEGMSCWF